MHFFDRAWHAGDMSDDRADEVRSAYEVHVTAILPRLPTRLRAFVQTVNIHDAQVRAVRLNRALHALELHLRAGDRQVGYFDLDIVYRDVRLDRLDSNTRKQIASDGESEALYDEVDLAGRAEYEHRWLWWPYRELDVQFSEFDYSVTPRADRPFDRVANPFVEILAPVG